MNVEIISSKSSEMNVLIPTPAGDDFVSKFLLNLLIVNLSFYIFFKVEQPVPEQFKTVIKGSSLHTSCNESLG